MEDCSKRAKELCALNLKGFALESRVNAVKSAVGVVCLGWIIFNLKIVRGRRCRYRICFEGGGLGVLMVNFVNLLSRWP